MKPAALAVVAATSTCLVTLVSLAPVRMLLSKIDTEVLAIWDRVFLEMSLPRLGVGLATVFGGACLHGRRPRLGLALVIVAPLLVLVAHLLLLAFNL
ncbi:hypothetical protein HZY97_17150 [Sphingomonas sp. R-74633]|uniref:hypothetical protein n=1 Tax=Sphingomonas sp. R-74633 TaxID=2751188 RepID=UPI0015D16283|nr:hypothetical protein [Sphingomonas sp. R-74633]NYT42502.1 hypothetical protein [Sphingomonas sp. R-74633]